MILNKLNKYITEVDKQEELDFVRTATIEEMVDRFNDCSNKKDKDELLSLIDEDRKIEMEKLIEGGIV